MARRKVYDVTSGRCASARQKCLNPPHPTNPTPSVWRVNRKRSCRGCGSAIIIEVLMTSRSLTKHRRKETKTRQWSKKCTNERPLQALPPKKAWFLLLDKKFSPYCTGQTGVAFDTWWTPIVSSFHSPRYFLNRFWTQVFLKTTLYITVPYCTQCLVVTHLHVNVYKIS